MDDLRRVWRTGCNSPLTGTAPIWRAVEGAFGADVDSGMLVKLYGEPTGQRGHERKYSPSECIGARKDVIEGSPDPAAISTAQVERHNRTMRMGLRRFTRLTNAFSRKLEKHLHMLSLYFVHYNFLRVQKSLHMSSAMAACVCNTMQDVEWIVPLIDARMPKPGPRGPYKRDGA